MFYTQFADGILGLQNAFGEGKRPLAYSLKQEGLIDKNAFALCLGRDGGSITFGAYNPLLNSATMQSENMVDQQLPRMILAIDRLSFGRNKNDESYSSQIGGREALVDSGNTLLTLPDDLFSEVMNNLQRFCEDAGSCALMDDSGCFTRPGTEEEETFFKRKI